MSEEKKLRCNICGKVINVPYVEALDGRIYHPECRGKSFKKRIKQRSNGKI